MPRALQLLPLFILLAGCAGAPSTSQSGRTASPVPDAATLIAAGDATRADGRFTEAAQIYQQVLVTDANSAAAQFGMAECLLGLGRPKDAKPIFAALVKQKDLHAEALQGLGIADLSLRNYDDSARSLHEALEADADLWRAWNGLGLITDLRRQPDEAAQLYEKALAINPNSAVVLNNRGFSRLGAGNTDGAIADFRHALALDPDSETVQNNLRLAIATKGNYAEATRSMPQRQQAVVLNNVGFIAMQRGDLTAAEGLLARAMEANSRYDAVTARNLQQLTALKAGTK